MSLANVLFEEIFKKSSNLVFYWSRYTEFVNVNIYFVRVIKFYVAVHT